MDRLVRVGLDVSRQVAGLLTLMAEVDSEMSRKSRLESVAT